jgi:hypothetical protein
MTAGADRRDQFISLAERYCKLGRLLPAFNELEIDDFGAIAEAKLILQEMAETKSEIDAVLLASVSNNRPTRTT